MMNSGELEDTTGIPETSRPASAASFTDVQTIETKTPPHDTCPQQGAASSTPAHNTDNMESFSDTEYHQELSAGDQAQLDDALAEMSPGLLEQQSFLTKLAEETFSSSSDSCPHQDQHNILGVRKETKHPQKKRAYIKKPLNAFMLFMKEKRPTVSPTIKRRGNRTVTAHLGSVWKSLSSTEQEKYYKEAAHLRFLHQQQHPDWSPSENYGKMLSKAKKRRLQKNRDEGKSSDSEPEESPPSKWMMLTPKYRKQASKKDGTEIHWDMKLRCGKRPNYRE